MAVQPHEKHAIALQQLETALRLFEEGQDFYSVITLAGAADEIFGKLLEPTGELTALASLTKASVAVHKIVHGAPGDEKTYIERANLARNALKHLKAGGMIVQLDINEEAADMIDRAITNYWALTSKISPAMERFENARRAS